MQTIDFVGNIAKYANGNLYCIYGEESFLIDQAFSVLRRTIDLTPAELNFSVFEKKADENVLIGVIESPPMIADKRMVHLKDSDVLKQKENEALIACLERMPESSVVVFTFLGKPDKRRKLFKLLSKKGILVEADPLKEETLIGWLCQAAIKKKCKLSRGAAKLMLDSCGRDMYTLENEIAKLAMICKEVIAEKDVLQYCAKTLDYNVFALHDLLIEGKAQKAMELLREILENEKTAIPVLALITGKFKLMYMARSCLNAGFTVDRAQKSIAGQTGTHPYAVKIAIEQCRKFSLEQLISAMELLAEYDYGLKSGTVSQSEGIERMLFRIYGLV